MSSNMKGGRAACVLAAAGLAVSLASSAGGGDLSPPVGPIQPTMTRLDAIEPRSSIRSLPGDATSVHLISQPGVFVLTENLVVPQGKSGIVIDIPPGQGGAVVIDLNGFSITGQPGSLHAVHYKSGGGGPHYFVCYTVNGATWNSMGGSGLVVDSADRVEISGVEVLNCGGDGVHIENTERASVSVSVADCAGDGIEFSQCPTVSCGRIKRDLEVDVERRTGSFRVAKCGGNGVVATGCDEVGLAGIEVTECGADGVHVDGGLSVKISDFGMSRCAGDGIEVSVLQAATSCRVSVEGGESTDNGCGVRVVLPPGGSSELNFASLDASGNLSDSGMVVSWGVGGGGGGGGGGSASASIRVSDTVCNENAGDGLRIDRDRSKTMDMTVEEFEACRNAGSGLKSYFQTGDKPTQDQFMRVSSAVCNDNGVHGMEIEECRVRVHDSDACDNGVDGLHVFHVTSPGHKYVDTLSLRCAGNGRHGGLVVGGSLTVSGSSFVDNGSGDPVGGSGLQVEGALSVSVSSSRCIGNTLSGLSVRDFDRDGLLDLVVCSSNGSHGVHVSSSIGLPSGRFRATGVFSDGNGDDGMRLESTTGGEVSQCTLSNNGGAGISIFGFGHVVHRCVVSNNTGAPVSAPVPGNSVGPLVDELGMAANCTPSANLVR